jgi:hypothetical protein
MLCGPKAVHSCLAREAGKNVSDEVHEEVSDHVGDKVSTPEVKSGQDSTGDERDQDVGPASGPMSDGEDDKRQSGGGAEDDQDHDGNRKLGPCL